MALEDVFKGGNIVTGLAIGVGATVLAPLVAPAVSALLRPTAKAVIKGGIVAYDWGRQAVAEVSEAASDMAAEVRAEAQRTGPAAATNATTGAKPDVKTQTA
jgi:hypothetical protein